MSIEIGKSYVAVDLQEYSGRYLVVGERSEDYGELTLIIKSESGEISEIDYEYTRELNDEQPI